MTQFTILPSKPEKRYKKNLHIVVIAYKLIGKWMVFCDIGAKRRKKFGCRVKEMFGANPGMRGVSLPLLE